MAGFARTMPKMISRLPTSTRKALGVGRFRPMVMKMLPVPMTLIRYRAAMAALSW